MVLQSHPGPFQADAGRLIKLELDESLAVLPAHIIDLLDGIPYEGDSRHEFTLCYDQDGLGLRSHQADKGKEQAGLSRVDFLAPTFLHRLNTSGKQQGIAKAVGLNKYAGLTVLDLTAGFGKDAFLLAYLGCEVIMLERSAVVHALLQDGLHRAGESDIDGISEALTRIRLFRQEAQLYLDAIMAGQYSRPDVIFIDPMYPQRSKSASVKKDIALLQDLLGTDADSNLLVKQALECARRRVVLKRPGKKGKGEELSPTFQVPGKTSHFEVFVP